MQKAPESRSAGHVVDDFAGQNRTIGGSSETDVTELAAMPTGPSAPWEAITVTPVGRCPSTSRKRRGSMSTIDVIASTPVRAAVRFSAAHSSTTVSSSPMRAMSKNSPRVGTDAPSSTSTGRSAVSIAIAWTSPPPVITGKAVTPARPLLG